MSLHPSYWDLNKERLILSALEDYLNNPNSTKGYDILRYASKGELEVSSDVDAQIFLDWYPLHQGYVILRLAKVGKLKMKG